MTTSVKFHAGIVKPTSLWIACGTFKSGLTMHSGVTTVADFKTLPEDKQCKKCAAKIKLLKL